MKGVWLKPSGCVTRERRERDVGGCAAITSSPPEAWHLRPHQEELQLLLGLRRLLPDAETTGAQLREQFVIKLQETPRGQSKTHLELTDPCRCELQSSKQYNEM